MKLVSSENWSDEIHPPGRSENSAAAVWLFQIQTPIQTQLY